MNIKETYKNKASTNCAKIRIDANRLMKSCSMLSEECNHPNSLSDAMQTFRSALLGLQIAIDQVDTEEDVVIPLIRLKDDVYEEMTDDDIISMDVA